MTPHKYNKYLHILTPQVGSDGSQHGSPPWEGITGRVKQLVAKSSSSGDAKLQDMEARLEAKLGEVQSNLNVQHSKLEQKLDKIEKLLSNLDKSST